MIRLGFIGLDSSHPRTFAETLDRLDHDPPASVSAVWDGGDVRDDAHVEQFCREFDATRYDEPTEMIDDVDAVMVLTVDWDTHASLAVPFLDAGVPTFVDKPIAGTVADVTAIADAASGTPLFGGSAVPYHPAIESLPAAETGRTFFATGYNDPFYYGAHLVDVTRSLAGGDWACVQPSTTPGKTVTVLFEDDSHATLQFDAPSEVSAYAVLDVTDSARTAFVDNQGTRKMEMYDTFLSTFLDTVVGNAESADWLLDSASLLLAVTRVLEDGRPITPRSDRLESVDVDGRSFLESYR